MASPFDTIVAPITGSDAAAVAIVRLSGPESWEIASKVFIPWPERPEPRYALYGHFSTGDDGLCLPFEAGHSYTGEESAELSVHGSRAAVRALVEACLACGARPARPGEFTERAFLNGRLDLTQAEGVRDTVEALTTTQLRQANLLREGALRDDVRAISSQIGSVLAAVEASVDFSEEIGELDKEAASSSLADALQRIDELLRTADSGRILRQGLRIALAGPPNAGKSSLLNRILGVDRALVTEIPGTTRDYVEERVDLGGVPCVLTDTAGLRDSQDRLEQLGMGRTAEVAAAADEIWFVYDGTKGLSSEDQAWRARLGASVLVQNKSDLGATEPSEPGSIVVSAKTGQGLDRLIAKVATRMDTSPIESVWINERHQPLLLSAREHLSKAVATLGQDLPTDLVSVHLSAALQDLGEITGETASEDMMERIFRDFCIGK